MPSTAKLKAFKLLTTSNAYWKGDARNQPMQRVYGTAFLSEKELQQHLTRLEEAKKRDHRKIGRDQKLFMFHQWAPGAAFWLGKGTTLYNTLANYMRGILFPAGYVEVKTPLVFNKALWETSGHWQHYRKNMFLVRGRSGRRRDGDEGHELPRPLPRLRIRGPQLPRPAASLARADAAAPQRSVRRALGPDPRPAAEPGRCALLRDGIADRRRGGAAAGADEAGVQRLRAALLGSSCPPGRQEFLGTVETWDHAEASLKQALERTGHSYTIDEGDGAFYGPKIDVDVTDAIGRKWQCATFQLDYQMPERFDLKYVGADNTEHRPVVIHRAIIGTFERFIGLLIEHFAGAWPLWLAPVQVILLPIADRHTDYARQVQDRLVAAGFRVELDDRVEKIGYKIREAQLQKVPYMLVIGDKEVADGTVGVQASGRRRPRTAAGREFIGAAVDEVARKDLNGPAA